MNGVILSLLTEMIEKDSGLDVLDQVLMASSLESQGAYTFAGTYPDDEFHSLVCNYSKIEHTPIRSIHEDLGEYVIYRLSEMYPAYYTAHTAKSFLMSLNLMVQSEFSKLYPEISFPVLAYEVPDLDSLEVSFTMDADYSDILKGCIKAICKIFHTQIRIPKEDCVPLDSQQFQHSLVLNFGGPHGET